MILNWEYIKDRAATAKYNSKMLLHMHTKKTASQKEESLTISQIEFGSWSVENVQVDVKIIHYLTESEMPEWFPSQ